MTTKPQTAPPPGTSEHAARLRSWRCTAWIAGGFTLLVGIGMITAHVRHKSSDPWRSPRLLDLKEQLLAEPRNEELKQHIRELDLGLRERYFRLLSVKGTGVYLLIGGTLVFLYTTSRIRRLNWLPPMPQPNPDAAEQLNRRACFSRNMVAACSLIALAGLSVLAFTRTRSPLADVDALANLLASDADKSRSAYPVSIEAKRSNWPRFRGFEGSGVAVAGPSLESVPAVIWQVPTPAPGFNSPLVWQERGLCTGGDAEGREVFCLNAGTGVLEWRQRVEVPAAAAPEEAPEIPEMTGYAASTAATDGERVYALFATGELAAFTLDGQRVWAKNLGPLDNPYGHAASLATWQDQVIVQLDQGDEDSRRSRIVALEGHTGELIWQKGRPVGASWATPIVVAAVDTPQVITLGLPWVIAYSPVKGSELWRVRLLEGEITPSPIFADGLLFIVDPGMYQLVALRLGGSGSIAQTNAVWRVDGAMPDITSPVSDGDRVFTLASDGTLSCFDARTGNVLWENSLDADGDFQASPSVVGDVLVVVSTAGDLIAAEAGPEFRELWRAGLEDEFYASPAFAHGKMYLRGNKSLWCLADSGKGIAQP